MGHTWSRRQKASAIRTGRRFLILAMASMSWHDRNSSGTLVLLTEVRREEWWNCMPGVDGVSCRDWHGFHEACCSRKHLFVRRLLVLRWHAVGNPDGYAWRKMLFRCFHAGQALACCICKESEKDSSLREMCCIWRTAPCLRSDTISFMHPA